ncbi:hypothetical protein GCM10010297_17880 [Streptomyces malachitofuscus]|nr:hypothetical protein GCM10010297_17880 [Streptomyces malachitofuscus]
MTYGEIFAPLTEVYGVEVPESTISTITDSVMVGTTEWQNCPPDSIYSVVFIDCVNREGQGRARHQRQG